MTKQFLLAVCLFLLRRVAEGSTQAATASSFEVSDIGESFSVLEMKNYDNYHWQDTVAVSLEGVELPAQETFDGKLLYRNGHGLRSFTFYGLSMKMYVASVYSEKPLRDANDALLCYSGCPLVFHFTFLRSVPQGRVRLAWQKQLDWSVSYKYDGFQADRDSFISMFGAMEDRGKITVKFLEGETLILDQGKPKGTIQGENFQRAFLSMWFGERAVADDLKVGLLGNSSSQTMVEAAA